MAHGDQGRNPSWNDASDDDSIARLEQALARIASAAGRRQDALRVAELTARAAQHEFDLMAQAQHARDTAALEQADTESARVRDALQQAGADQERVRTGMRELADRLDGLISRVRDAALSVPPDATVPAPAPEGT